MDRLGRGLRFAVGHVEGGAVAATFGFRVGGHDEIGAETAVHFDVGLAGNESGGWDGKDGGEEEREEEKVLHDCWMRFVVMWNRVEWLFLGRGELQDANWNEVVAQELIRLKG